MGLYPHTPTPTTTHIHPLSNTHTHSRSQEVVVTPRRDGAAIRRERMNMVLEFIRQNPGIRIEEIQITIALRTGLTKKRVGQYVQELAEGGRVKMEGTGFKVAEKR